MPIRARESSLAFEELHDLFVGHDAYPRHLEAGNQQLVISSNFTKTKHSALGGSQSWSFMKHDYARGPLGSNLIRNFNGTQRDCRRSNNISGRSNYSNRHYHPKCQLCDQLGHITKSYPQFHSQNVSINCATTSDGRDKNWLLDLAASHNITGDLSNLSIHSEYDGTDEVILSDDSGLAISHTSSLALHYPHRTFTLCDTLCVPNLCKKLISVHHLTKQNNVFAEFHPFYFLLKDKISGAILLKGACNNGIYTFPESIVTSKKVANVHERTSIDGWYVLGILLLKLSFILLKFFLFLFHRQKLCLHYVIHVLSIKLINNPFVSIVSKVMSYLNLFTLMCGVLLVILELMDQDITLFLLIIIQNIYGFIQWSLNPVFLKIFHILNGLLKPAFKNQSKHYTPTMVVSYYFKIISTTSWHNSLHYCSAHTATKWCI